jgi:hypothetical protein
LPASPCGQVLADIEQIAATGNRPDHHAVNIAELLAQLANALHQRIVGNCHVAPNGIVKLLLGDETPGILGEMAQEMERLRPQIEVASATRTQPRVRSSSNRSKLKILGII